MRRESHPRTAPALPPIIPHSWEKNWSGPGRKLSSSLRLSGHSHQPTSHHSHSLTKRDKEGDFLSNNWQGRAKTKARSQLWRHSTLFCFVRPVMLVAGTFHFVLIFYLAPDIDLVIHWWLQVLYLENINIAGGQIEKKYWYLNSVPHWSSEGLNNVFSLAQILITKYFAELKLTIFISLIADGARWYWCCQSQCVLIVLSSEEGQSLIFYKLWRVNTGQVVGRRAVTGGHWGSPGTTGAPGAPLTIWFIMQHWLVSGLPTRLCRLCICT